MRLDCFCDIVKEQGRVQMQMHTHVRMYDSAASVHVAVSVVVIKCGISARARACTYSLRGALGTTAGTDMNLRSCCIKAAHHRA